MRKSYYNYPIEFVEDIFGESDVLATVLRKVTGAETPKVLIVADMNVVQRTEGLGSRIGRYVQAHNITLAGSPVVLAGGEKIKADNLQSALSLVSAMLTAKVGQSDVILALGGGTVLDVAGWAAAQVRGGTKIVRLPTTPTAMIDAAYADYAAIDSASVKDALRVASLPSAVLIDTNFAKTVLDGVWRSGLSEAVRYALAADAPLLKKIEALVPAYQQRDQKALEEVVHAVSASRIKKGDTKFAEWAALRLEALSGYKLPHGYAIAMALAIEVAYAVEKGMITAANGERVMTILKENGSFEGAVHSNHLLSQTESLLLGIDAWRLSIDGPSIPLLSALGKTTDELEPDREVYEKVFKNFSLSVAKG